MHNHLFFAAAYASALGLSALGSVAGVGVAGMTAIGAGKRCLMQGKPFPFMLIAFVGAPLTQTIYGFLLMNTIIGLGNAELAKGAAAASWVFALLLAAGVFGGLVIGGSAYVQGRMAGCSADAFAETGQGFANYMMMLGIIESVALFVMIFFMVALPKLAG